MKSFTKIFQLGHNAIKDIFNGHVEMSEKLDGSQFRFYKDEDNVIHTYSKGKEIFYPTTDKLFIPAVDHVNSVTDRIPIDMYFYSETLCKPKHNTIKYDKVPLNHIAVFGVYNVKTQVFLNYNGTKMLSDQLDVDTVPLIYKGLLKDGNIKDVPVDWIHQLLERQSYLGGSKIEGIVVRSVEKAVEYMGLLFPMAIGKYVSEAFKEKHDKGWKNKGSKNSWLEFMEIYRNENRWMKAFQHLRDAGEIEDEPRDIGKLIIEAQNDITDECKEEITDWLWKIYGKQLLRHSIKGLPEWYKEKLLTDL